MRTLASALFICLARSARSFFKVVFIRKMFIINHFITGGELLSARVRKGQPVLTVVR